MVSAMDRALTTPRRPSRWFVAFLTLFFSSVDIGCAELKSQIHGDTKLGELGRVEETNDIYARNGQPRVLMPPPGSPSGPGQVVAPGTILTEVQEAGPALLPAEVKNNGLTGSGGVALQSPRPVDPGSGLKLTSNTTPGVPNAARILAAAERKPEIKPETLVTQARAALESLTAYEVSLRRQERVNGSLQPEEDVLVAIHRNPMAVRLSWPSGPNQGREVLYRADEPGGQMHIKLANPALPRMSMSPESPMVMKNSRHPVTEAGFDSLIEGLENGVKSSDLTYAGIETPPGLDRPAHCLTRITPSGEHWRVYLDLESHLPSLVQAMDSRGELVERYIFRDLKANPEDLATTASFDPIARWGQPRGLLGRLARGTNESQSAADSGTTPR